MENKALAETYVDLWIYINKEFKSKRDGATSTDITNMVFEQICKRIISDLIGKQRSSGGSTQSSSSDEKPTEKQIRFANTLGCNNPEGFSKKELSAWIEENKTY
ncbi:unnamed protein product [marine sediment metagenome]|uniref:Uncharacterized protein n=1 Tax=marine sediment metagenome TaxID=412755 RepID=X0VYR8_9ZZZZ